MILLGIETSGPVGSFALRRDSRCIEECLLPELGRRHARSLVPEVIEFLARHQLRLAEVEAFAVSVGPGSFTGVRVGVTFAKTAAYALDRPLAAVQTFDALAVQCTPIASVAVVADAQRRGVMLGCYDRMATGEYARRGEITLVSRDRLPEALGSVEVVTGSGLGDDLDVNSIVKAAPSQLRLPRAATVARLGEAQIRRGEIADAWSLEPTYVRKSGAEEKRDEQDSGSLPG